MNSMKIEVLVATMNQNDDKLVEKMNIKTDCIIGNQSNVNEIIEYSRENQSIKYLTFAEKGVGLNRNNSLMRASGDIILFADDDMRYFNNYAQILLKEYSKLPKADVIIFNIKNSNRNRYTIRKHFRVNKFNYMRFGATRISAKNRTIKYNGILFNLNFGGGTTHSNGEDTLFLKSCLDKKLKIYASPEFIAELTEERPSTWFVGYNDKFLLDKGVLFRALSKKFSYLLCLIHAIKNRKIYHRSVLNIFMKMIEGIKFFERG